MAPRIELLVTPGCRNIGPAEQLVRDVRASLAPEALFVQLEIRTTQEAIAHAFAGSPTLRVDGVDVDPAGARPGVLACRIYDGGTGIPPRWRLEAAILRALAPRHILFLCVANSARSQLAEGIARTLAPPGQTVSSAGSAPSHVRPQAIEVLREIGIDISAHSSKSVSEIDASTVDAVITLCAEEVCPVFLGNARRVHWALHDPAAANGSEEDVLQAFRRVRDQLRERLAVLLQGGPA